MDFTAHQILKNNDFNNNIEKKKKKNKTGIIELITTCFVCFCVFLRKIV